MVVQLMWEATPLCNQALHEIVMESWCGLFVYNNVHIIFT